MLWRYGALPIVHAVGGDFEKSRKSEREFMALYEKVAQAAKDKE